MTLRSPFKGQQLLFILACSAVLSGRALAQAPAAPTGPDTVILQGNRAQQGKVLGLSGGGLQIQIGAGTIALPLASIVEVRMAPPAEFAAAQRAVLARDFKAAEGAMNALQKYRGLPVDWAQQATSMAGDVYVETGQLEKAEAAYKDFQRLYPNAQNSGPQAEVGMARLAVARKDLNGAKQRLEPIATKAMTEKVIPPAAAYAYSQVFLLLGEVKEAQGDLAGALENYLRTVTIFYQDRAAAARAQEKADALRKAHPEVFVS